MLSRSHVGRRGAASLNTLIVVSSIVLIGLIAYLATMSRRAPGVADLTVFCAAGMRYPMEQIVEQFKEEFGATIQVQYGGSNTLLSQIEAGKSGDLFLAADESYVRLAQQKDLAREVLPLATMRPVIVVRRDSPLNITALADLLQPGIRIACGNPDAAAIGRITKTSLEKCQQWDALAQRISENGVYKPTVNEVANDVKLGSVDAGIVWDSTAAQYPELKPITVAELQEGVAHVELCVLKYAMDPAATLHFARYVAACDRGLKTFQAEHYQVVEGDVWESVPELTFFAGSVNRRALEPIIKAFEQREGVTVNTIYNGCGILTGTMQGIVDKNDEGFPDTYMACDVYYLETVKQWFQEAVNISDTSIVIAVQKGNPKEIRTVQDLVKPGVRVAIGQPDQCTIGVLTRRLLEHEGVYDTLLRENVVTQTATSALLVPAVTAKSADAALAYQTDTLAERDKVDVIAIESEWSKAIQPFSIARSSRQKYLGRRLYAAISRSRSDFESAGFHWRLDATQRENSISRDAPAHTPPSQPPDTP